MTSRTVVRLGAAVLCWAVLAGSAPAQVAPAFTDPIRLGLKRGDSWEPAIAADRFGHVYAVWTEYGFDPACPSCATPHTELQISSDGGRTWSRPRPLERTNEIEVDPQVVVDPVDGKTVYAAFMRGDKFSQYVAKSTDFGKTWKSVLVEDIERSTDKDILAVRGRHIYLVYNAVMKIYASVSHDGGRTWTVHPIVHNTNSELGWSLPGGGAVDSKGNAYFAWGGYERNGKPSGEVNLFVTKTTDGGRTWTTSLVDVSEAPPECGKECGWAYWGAQMTLAVDARDRVYVLYNANRRKFGVNRMFFARSVDGGETWVGRREVSNAPRGANNLFPAIAARGNGDVRIAWQDDRNGFDAGSNDPTARWNTWYRSSSDAGRTWSPEAKLSEFVPGYAYKRARPEDGYLEPYGDYFEIDIGRRGRTHALWGEGHSWIGPGNVWYARSVPGG